MSDSDFTIFRTYLGALRRKEDFFTYYLASVLEFLAGWEEDQGDTFRKVLSDVFGINGDWSVVGNSGVDEVFRKRYLEKPTPKLCFWGDGGSRNIFREVPLSNPNEMNRYDYLDLAFALKNERTQQLELIGIEGKVFDQSVEAGQLKRYSGRLKRALKEQVGVKLYLLSTTDSPGSKSLGAVKSARTEGVEVDLILWSHFNNIVSRIESAQCPYLTRSWEDAWQQLEENREREFAPRAPAERRILHSTKEYLLGNQASPEDEALFNELWDFVSEILKKYPSSNETKEKTVRIRFASLEENELMTLAKRLLTFLRDVENFENLGPGRRLSIKAGLKKRIAGLSELRNTRADELKALTNKPGFSQENKNALQRVEMDVRRRIESSDIEKLIDEFILHIEDNEKTRAFYELVLGENGLLKNDKVRFHSDVENGKVRNLGIHVKLISLPVGRTEGKVSAVTLQPDGLTFQRKR